MSKKRVKSTLLACQSKAEVMDNITEIGNKQREIARLEAEMNDKIAEITDSYKGNINALQLDVERLTHQAQIWCEANRNSLLDKGLKTANLIVGEVSWRYRPAKVNVRKEDFVIEQLEQQGLTQFIRVKKNVNKDAVLADRQAVQDIDGITIVDGVEDFVITPFEIEVA